MQLKYQTPIDPTLDHQVQFAVTKVSNSHQIAVSCNCLDGHPMGVSKDLDEARELYNDPGNHRKDFTQKWRAKW